MDALEGVESALDEAQTELTQAEIALIEATARAEEARKDASRLEAAVAALRGEPPPAVNDTSESGIESDSNPDDEGSSPSRRPIQDLSPEEFDKQRKRKQRAREKEAQANNPLAHLKCTGCGLLGTLVPQMITTPGGATVQMLSCSSCGNQVIT